jgi:hypothetical protein
LLNFTGSTALTANGVNITLTPNANVALAGTSNLILGAQFQIPGTDIVLTGNANANPLVASWNYIIPMSASSYVQIYWSTPDAAVRMTAVGTRTGPIRPAVPSVIATLTQIA